MSALIHTEPTARAMGCANAALDAMDEAALRLAREARANYFQAQMIREARAALERTAAGEARP